MRHFLEIDDLTGPEIENVLTRSRAGEPAQVLASQGVGLVFEKPSSRTRNSMEMAVVQLGGHPVSVRPDEIGIDTREPAEDIAKTLGGYHALVCLRVFEHAKLERMAASSPVPVVNMLSDDGHPLQVLADLLTIEDEFGDLPGRTIAYVGDGNNVCRSLALGAGLLGMGVRVASPSGYGLDEYDVARIGAVSADPVFTEDPHEAVDGADVIYTDVWASMGQEEEAAGRYRAFEGFTIDEQMMAGAASEAIFLHCLPAHRGEEATGAVVDGPSSRIWPQAQNRMHSARGLLWWLREQA